MSVLVRHEARLAWRYGIVAATTFVTATWVGVLSRLPAAARADVLPYVVMLDVGIIGLYFVGALVLLERGERTLAAMATAPVRPVAALAARVAVLTALAVAASTSIAVSSTAAVDPLLLTLGVVAMSVQCTLAGAAVVAPFSSITDYVAAAPLPLLPVSAPVVLHAAGVEHAALHLLPVHGSVQLLAGAFAEVEPGAVAASLASSVVWSALLGTAVLVLHERLIRRRL